MADESGSAIPTCFIMMPITTRPEFLDRYGGRGDHFVTLLETLMVPAVEKAGYAAVRPEAAGTTNIQAKIINDLTRSDMVLVDLSTLNENVFLELGIRTALDKPMSLVWDGHDKLPFDTNTINTHKYESPSYDTAAEVERIANHIRDSDQHRNPLWKWFGTAATALPAGAVNPDDATVDAKLDAILKIVDRPRPTGGTSRGMWGLVKNPLTEVQTADRLGGLISSLGIQSRGVIALGQGQWVVTLLNVDEDDHGSVSARITEESRAIPGLTDVSILFA